MRLPYLELRKVHWATRFYHPIARVVVSRSLHILAADLRQAQAASNLLDLLIHDRSWWTADRRKDAEKISRHAAASFYDRLGIEVEPDSIEIQDDGSAVLVASNDSVLQAELESAKRELALLRAALPEQTAGKPKTVAQAFDSWSVNFRAKSERETKSVKHRVGLYAAHAGAQALDTLSVDTVEAAIAAISQGNADSERGKRLRDIKRFLTAIVKTHDLKALGPVVDGLCGKTAAYMPEKDQIDEAALHAFLNGPALPEFDLQFKAMIATFSGAGLRASELCNLQWPDLDFEREIIHVRPSDVKAKLKTRMSARAIRCLPHTWPWLRLLLQAGPPPCRWVFPRVQGGKLTDKSWLTLKMGQPNADRLSRVLGRMESVFGLGREIPLRSRRFWTTKIREFYPEHVCNVMGGHSSAIANQNYVDLVERVASARKLA